MQQVLRFSALATGAAWVTASVTSLACTRLSQRIVTRILGQGFQRALWVCGLTGLAAIPVA